MNKQFNWTAALWALGAAILVMFIALVWTEGNDGAMMFVIFYFAPVWAIVTIIAFIFRGLFVKKR